MGSFWSSSPFADIAGYAWYVHFYFGLDGNGRKDDDSHVRLVRGGK